MYFNFIKILLYVLFWLPCKIISFFISWRKMIFTDFTGLGDHSLNMKYYININKKIDLWVEKKYFDLYKKIMIDNQYVKIFSYEDEWRWYTPFIKMYRIIYVPPYVALYIRSMKIFKISIMSFRFKQVITIPKRSHGPLAKILLIFFKAYSFNLSKTLLLDENNFNDNMDLFWKRKFKMYDNNFPIKLNNYFNDKKYNNYVLININGNFDGSKKLSPESINCVIENIPKDKKIIYVGIFSLEKKYTEIINKNKNSINLINKTNIIDLFSLVKFADCILTVETSIIHISSIWNKKCLVWYPEKFIVKNNLNMNIYNNDWLLHYSYNYYNNPKSNHTLLNFDYLLDENMKYEFNKKHEKMIIDAIK
ncbi:MAG: hypothetical protein NC236_00455 [Mycoplasma sp.]|nr:hypothetical protein [Mycoplasma sp.]